MNTPHNSFAGKRIAFYAIGLTCEAAPHIACGIRAKPILAALEANSHVSGAWFSRSGTTLAIEWAETGMEVDQQMDIIRSALGEDAAAATRIVDAAAIEGLQRAFDDGHAWYRKNEIDELSEEESWVIASRLVLRMLSTIDLDSRRQELVRRVIAHACGSVLTTSEPGTPATREKLLGNAILNAACCELDSHELDALGRALACGGHRPVAGEG